MDATLTACFVKLKELSSPRSTLLIGTLVSKTVENELRGDENNIELPSHFTKKEPIAFGVGVEILI